MPSDIVHPVDYKVFHHHSKPQSGIKHRPQINLSRTQLVDTVASILEGMIEERMARFTDIKEVPNETVFHAKKLPSISIKDYLTRFAMYSQCHEDAFVYALIYLDKVGENLDDFSLDTFNAHRLLLVCLVSACKFYDDYYYKNSYYAKIGGLKPEELNNLEQEFLADYIQFSLYVKTETYAEYYQDLVTYCQDKTQETEAS